MAFSDRYVAMYFDVSLERFAIPIAIEIAGNAGVNLGFHGLHTISVINAVGDAINCSLGQVDEYLKEERNVTVQLWWEEFNDLCIRISAYSKACCVHFYLEGNDEDRFNIIEKCARIKFLELSCDGLAISMASDRTGESAEYFDVSTAIGDAKFQLPFPDEILCKKGSRIIALIDPQLVIVTELSHDIISITPALSQ